MTERRSEGSRALTGIAAGVLWAAISFAADGVLAVIIDRDPITADVGPYYAVVAFASAGLAVGVVTARTTTAPRPGCGAVAAAASVYLLFLLVALPWQLGLALDQATSPFTAVAVVVAAFVVVGFWGVRHLPTVPPDGRRGHPETLD